jgi:peroxidase
MISLLAKFQPIGGIANLVDPSLNPVPGAPELIIAPPNFAPGTTNDPISGPNARTLSNVISGGQSASGDNANTPNPNGASDWLPTFGQFVDHDLDLQSVGTTDISILVPNGDPNFADGTVIPLDRAITDPETGTLVNSIAGTLDLSQVYGSTAETAASLRNADGTLKTSAGNNLPIVDGIFVSGDIRVAENPKLIAITTLFAREHNYWVEVLRQQHPAWTGDQLYYQARAITIAEYQNVVYTQYLPALIGASAIAPYQGFQPNVSTQVTQEFSTAAFRVGHTQIANTVMKMSNDGVVLATQTLAESFVNTTEQDLANGGLNAVIRALADQPSEQVDVYAVDSLRNLLVDGPDGLDLIAVDIQRERDVGLGTLNQTRIALGLAPYTSFAQLTDDPTVQANLASQFASIDDVDLFLGGVAENHVAGAGVGQTFQAIIADQFNRLRDGDQFWWQNEGFDHQTSRMISQTTLADIIERNSDTAAMQRNVFFLQERHTSGVAAADPTAPQLVMGADANGAWIKGGPQSDTMVAGDAVHQILTGGGGADVFQFNGGGHIGDMITDWDSKDVIQFQLSGSSIIHAVIDLISVRGGTQVQFLGNSIYLPDVDPSSLTVRNFLLPPGDTVSLHVIRPRESGHGYEGPGGSCE